LPFFSLKNILIQEFHNLLPGAGGIAMPEISLLQSEAGINQLKSFCKIILITIHVKE